MRGGGSLARLARDAHTFAGVGHLRVVSVVEETCHTSQCILLYSRVVLVYVLSTV